MNDLDKDNVLEETEQELKEEKEEDAQEVNEESIEKTEEATEDNSLALEGEESAEQTEEEKFPEMNPIVEVETTYDYKVLKYCNMYVIKVKRKSVIINIIMALVCLGIGGLILYSSIKNGNNNYIFSILTFLLAVWVIYSIFTEEKRIDKSLVNYFKTHAPVKQKFSFDNERIRITANVNGEERKADYPWAYVTEIHAIPEYFFLFINGGAPIVIDRNEESVVTGSLAELEDLIRSEASLKPFKSYNKPLVKHMVDVTYFTPVETPVEEEAKEDLESTEENKEEKQDNE